MSSPSNINGIADLIDIVESFISDGGNTKKCTQAIEGWSLSVCSALLTLATALERIFVKYEGHVGTSQSASKGLNLPIVILPSLTALVELREFQTWVNQQFVAFNKALVQIVRNASLPLQARPLLSSYPVFLLRTDRRADRQHEQHPAPRPASVARGVQISVQPDCRSSLCPNHKHPRPGMPP
jgi:hypothetical protein